MKSRLLLLCCLSASLLATSFARPAAAAFPSSEPYIGLFGGGHLAVRDWDLGNPATRPLNVWPKSSADVGLRLGWQLSETLAVEAGLGWMPLTSTAGKSNNALRYDLDLLWHVLPTNWSPFVVAGLGAYQSLSGGDLGSDVDPQVHLGVGVRGLVLPWLALRAEARAMVTDGTDKAGDYNTNITAGVDIFFGAHGPKIADRDGDGIADDKDKCPDAKGTVELEGCPPKTAADRDGDGIADDQDKCPDVKGIAALAGCPDRDGDGIADDKDKCPDVKGLAALAGCPDRDGDGVADADDKCPDVKGKAELKGCPDRDNDGVADADDKCPDLFGTANRKGCPDRDGDGILDADDKCPDVAGVIEAQGCLPKAAEKFAGVIKGINFDTGKSEILKSSFKLLDGAIAVLKQFPSMRLRIEGHTDNVGKEEDNLKLSQARADAVRDYFVKNGLDKERFVAEGNGDRKPRADNSTPKGRAENRRIEFAVVGAQ